MIRNLIRIILLGLAVTFAMNAQISVKCSPRDQKTTQSLLNKKLSKNLTAWGCTITNQSPTESVSVYESSILGVMDHLNPIDHNALAIIGNDAVIRSLWNRLGIGGAGTVEILAYFLSNKQFRIGSGWIMGATAMVALAPDLLKKFSGATIPVNQKIAAFIWTQPVDLIPGGSNHVTIFTTKWTFVPGKDSTQEFTIDSTSKAVVRQIR